MTEAKACTTTQLTTLVVLRSLVGWLLLYEGISKLLISNWSLLGFLQESKWILPGIAKFVPVHNNVLGVVDFMNTWGLILIGLGLIFGLFSRLASVSGALLLLLYYLNNPPLIGLEYYFSTEGSHLVVSKALIESTALLILAVFPTSSLFGLGIFAEKYLKLNDER